MLLGSRYSLREFIVAFSLSWLVIILVGRGNSHTQWIIIQNLVVQVKSLLEINIS